MSSPAQRRLSSLPRLGAAVILTAFLQRCGRLPSVILSAGTAMQSS
jgi:hypothetical protein